MKVGRMVAAGGAKRRVAIISPGIISDNWADVLAKRTMRARTDALLDSSVTSPGRMRRRFGWRACFAVCTVLVGAFVVFDVYAAKSQSLGLAQMSARNTAHAASGLIVLPLQTLGDHDPASFIKLATIAVSPDPPVKPDYALPPVADGMAPVLTRIPTRQPVVFLTIDDGAHKDITDLHALQDSHNTASLFLADAFMRNDPDFFKQYVSAGYPVENHTRNHILRPHQSYEIQKSEICGEADMQQRQFGRRPLLFRPPGGFYDATTLRAAADCGMKAVVMWHAKAESGAMMYQDGNTGLQPGDIVLMHFRPEFKQDLAAFVAAQNAAGLHAELLENWLL